MILTGCNSNKTNIDKVKNKNIISLNSQIQEKDNYCTAACMSVIADYFGYYILQGKIWKNAVKKNMTDHNGILDCYILDFFRQKGLFAYLIHGDIQKVKYLLSKSLPVIYLSRYDFLPHAIIFYGYDDSKKGFYYFDPKNGSTYFIENKKAALIFEESFYLSIVISPKKLNINKNWLISEDLLCRICSPSKEQLISFYRNIKFSNYKSEYASYLQISYFFIQKEYINCVAISKEFIKEYGANGNIYGILGLCYHFQSDYKNAEYYYKLSINTNPYNTSIYQNIANVELHNKEYNEMYEYVERGLKNNPTYLPLYHYLKEYELKNNKFNNLRKIITKYIELYKYLDFFHGFKKTYYKDLEYFLTLQLDVNLKSQIQEILDKQKKDTLKYQSLQQN